jgi:hypothetical protein
MSSLPANIPELLCKTNKILITVTRDILANVWEEMEYQTEGSLKFMQLILIAPVLLKETIRNSLSVHVPSL